MSDPVDALVLDLCEWLSACPRPYSEVMEAWRTSCPRLTVWEDAVDRGLVARRMSAEDTPVVLLTFAGECFLRQSSRHVPAPPRQDRIAIAGGG